MAKSQSSKTSKALMGLGYVGAGAGSGVICLPEDNSFVCTIKRLVGTIQGIAFLLVVVFLIYWMFKNRKNLSKILFKN